MVSLADHSVLHCARLLEHGPSLTYGPSRTYGPPGETWGWGLRRCCRILKTRKKLPRTPGVVAVVAALSRFGATAAAKPRNWV